MKPELGRHLVCPRCHGKGTIGRKHIKLCPTCEGHGLVLRQPGT